MTNNQLNLLSFTFVEREEGSLLEIANSVNGLVLLEGMI